MCEEAIYDFLLNEFKTRFEWLNLSDDVQGSAAGLPTVLMDSVISRRFAEEFNKDPGSKDKWASFFDFLEELLDSGDSSVTDVIETTIIEMIAADYDVKLESVLPYCGSRTRNSIYCSISDFYGKPQKAENLKNRFSLY